MANETANVPTNDTTTTPQTNPASPHTQEAKSRFNAALEEAKAGARELSAEARERAQAWRGQASAKGEGWQKDAQTTASDFATEGKAKASSALSGLSKIVDENAIKIDENLGPKYGDYARSASRSIQRTAEQLDQKSVEELGEDAREFVRKNPGTAVGIAAAFGFLFARLFRK